MPSNRNSQNKRRTRILDIDIIKRLVDWEQCIYTYIDKAMPKKHRYTLVSQLTATIGEAREFAIESMDIARWRTEEKHHKMSLALARLHNAEVLLNMLNDFQDVSDQAKAVFDSQLIDIYAGISSLLSTYQRKLGKDDICQISEGTPTEESEH